MDEHQVFFVGSSVEGPAAITNPNAIIQQLYDDVDNYGYPIGLKSTIVSTNTGSGVLNIQLRHLPMLKGELLKYDGLAALMANEGEQAMPGSTDISVDFNITMCAMPGERFQSWKGVRRYAINLPPTGSALIGTTSIIFVPRLRIIPAIPFPKSGRSSKAGSS